MPAGIRYDGRVTRASLGYWVGVVVSCAALGCGDDGGGSASAASTGTGSATDSGVTGGPTTSGDTPTGSVGDTSSSGGDSQGQTTCDGDCATTTPLTGTSATDPSTGTATETGPGTGDTGSSSTTGPGCEGAECCMAMEVFCGDVCCAQGEVCNFTKCEQPGNECKDKADCGELEYCDFSLGEPVMMPDPNCMGGVIEPTGKCLTKPPLCAPNDPPQDPNDPECLQSCQYDPGGGFNPTLKFSWGGLLDPPTSSDIMMTPVVIELDDDDCDGQVTERDIPEIVFSTFSSGQYGTNGSLHAISVVDGALVDKWNVLQGVINPTKQLAAGNFDGLPGNEIVGCGVDGKARAVKGEDGSLLWTSAALTCFMPSIADMDGDGEPEVIIEGAILDGATGASKAVFNPPLNSSFIIGDLDGDGANDVITSSRGYHADGALFVDTKLADQSSFYGTQDWKSPWPAIADFDKDGSPEVVVIDNLNHALSIWRHDALQPNKFAVVRGPVDINGALSPALCAPGSWGNTHGGGPPTIADFDGDGTPDVGTAGGIGYAVFSGKQLIDPQVPAAQTFLWIKQTTDCSSASTGSSVFDFDGDGKAEVVYSDQNRLRVYEGPTGDVLVERCNTTATLIEYPVIADVDNDGQADIVVISNAYAKNSPGISCTENGVNGQSGVRVFGTAGGKWVRTRRVWNQHAYYITNVIGLA